MSIDKDLYLRLLVMEHGLSIKESQLNSPDVLNELGLKPDENGIFNLHSNIGITPNEVNSLDSVPNFKIIKTIHNICRLFDTGLALYKPEDIMEIKTKVCEESLACYDSYGRQAVESFISFTQKNESIFTPEGRLYISTKQISRENAEIICKAIFLTMLGQDTRLLYLKGTIATLNITTDAIRKRYLDSNLSLVIKLAEYLETTANNLLGNSLDVDYYAKNKLFVLPSINAKSVLVSYLYDSSETIQTSKSSIDDFCNRIQDIVTLDGEGKLIVNGTRLQEMLS